MVLVTMASESIGDYRATSIAECCRLNFDNSVWATSIPTFLASGCWSLRWSDSDCIEGIGWLTRALLEMGRHRGSLPWNGLLVASLIHMTRLFLFRCWVGAKLGRCNEWLACNLYLINFIDGPNIDLLLLCTQFFLSFFWSRTIYSLYDWLIGCDWV